MKFFKTLLMAALFSLGASHAHACGVDAVSGKTDTTITIAWDINCNNFLKVELCWKNAANSGNVCNPPAMAFYTTTGSYTIAGLQPQTPYKIKTHWRTKNSAWREITDRIVTTNPSPAASVTTLRYEKGSGQKYSVTFYWKNPPTASPTNEWKLVLKYRVKQIIGWSGISSVDHPFSLNASTNEYYWTSKNIFSNNRKYQACLAKKYTNSGHSDDLYCISNELEWK
jgi:hypothetical protein